MLKETILKVYESNKYIAFRFLFSAIIIIKITATSYAGVSDDMMHFFKAYGRFCQYKQWGRI